MDQDKFINSYIELLNATLTEALQKNIVLQVQKRMAEEEAAEIKENLNTQSYTWKNMILSKDTQIDSLKNQINEIRSSATISEEDKEELKKSVFHVNTFKSELVKARAEIKILTEKLQQKEESQAAVKKEKKKTKLLEIEAEKETIKDAGNF